MPKIRKSKEQWLMEFNLKHKGKYDYSKANFLTSSIPIEIICPKHGSFFQKPSNHRNGSGCPQCYQDKQWNEDKLRTEIFIRYGNIYNLDKFVVGHNSEKMIIGCNLCNKDFYISRETLTKFRENLCPHCKRLDTKKCIELANKKHNYKYDYSKYIFNGSMKKSIIICKEHGEFEQQTAGHIFEGKGCPICAAEKTRFKSKDLDTNIKEIMEVHGNRYDYSNLQNNHKAYDKITIVCKEHGEFVQILNNHKNGSGCPKCNSNGGEWQHEIIEFLKNECKVQNIIERSRTIISKELDIYLPDYNFAIELNGFIFHSFGKTFPNNSNIWRENFKSHQNKFLECREKNIQLIQISDLDWKYKTKKEIWKNIIKHKIKLTTNNIGARRLFIKIPSIDEEKEFLNQYHIQGYSHSSIRYGLYTLENKLVYIMTFIKNRYSKIKIENDWELLRCCGIHSANINGGASKLLKHFEDIHKPERIFTFANLDYSSGNLYNKLNFKLLRISPPNFKFIDNRGKRYSRQTFQKHKLKDLYFNGKLENYNENLSSIQNLFNNNYRLLPDAGNMVFEKLLKNCIES